MREVTLTHGKRRHGLLYGHCVSFKSHRDSFKANLSSCNSRRRLGGAAGKIGEQDLPNPVPDPFPWGWSFSRRKEIVSAHIILQYPSTIGIAGRPLFDAAERDVSGGRGPCGEATRLLIVSAHDEMASGDQQRQAQCQRRSNNERPGQIVCQSGQCVSRGHVILH